VPFLEATSCSGVVSKTEVEVGINDESFVATSVCTLLNGATTAADWVELLLGGGTSEVDSSDSLPKPKDPTDTTIKINAKYDLSSLIKRLIYSLISCILITVN